MNPWLRRSSLILAAGALLPALPARGASADEAWNLHAQSTVIEQWHGAFPALYSGPNSLSDAPEDKHTATLTLFFGWRLRPGTELYVNPEVTEGTGLSGATGLAGFPNGEATKAGSTRPEFNTARLFLRQTFNLGGGAETLDDAPNQVAGTATVRRLTLTLGKLSATDIFDHNTYSNDPRTQFLNWALMDNGAWDYPADTKGYTGGFTAELHLARRALRWGVFLEPAEANGLPLDHHLSKARGQVFEWEERFQPGGRPAALRVLAYLNEARMGSYADALAHSGPDGPDITLSRRYRDKYGFGLNWEQELAPGLGCFARLGWDDGRTETWAFTEIDRTASAGLSLQGRTWGRPDDVLGLAGVVNGLAPDHRRYLAAGGDGMMLGDGALNYAPEQIAEAYYAWRAVRWLTLTLDAQFAANPGYNRDRGPVPIFAVRAHAEF